MVKGRPEEARRMLHNALLTDRAMAVATFGPLADQRYMDSSAAWLHETGDGVADDNGRPALSHGVLCRSGAENSERRVVSDRSRSLTIAGTVVMSASSKATS